jgi:hypothetical protein
VRAGSAELEEMAEARNALSAELAEERLSSETARSLLEEEHSAAWQSLGAAHKLALTAAEAQQDELEASQEVLMASHEEALAAERRQLDIAVATRKTTQQALVELETEKETMRLSYEAELSKALAEAAADLQAVVAHEQAAESSRTTEIAALQDQLAAAQSNRSSIEVAKSVLMQQSMTKEAYDLISSELREAQAEATDAREERDLQLAEGATSRSKMVETEAELAVVRMRLEQAVTTLDSTRHEHCELGEVHEHLKLTHAAQQVEHAEHTERAASVSAEVEAMLTEERKQHAAAVAAHETTRTLAVSETTERSQLADAHAALLSELADVRATEHNSQRALSDVSTELAQLQQAQQGMAAAHEAAREELYAAAFEEGRRRGAWMSALLGLCVGIALTLALGLAVAAHQNPITMAHVEPSGCGSVAIVDCASACAGAGNSIDDARADATMIVHEGHLEPAAAAVVVTPRPLPLPLPLPGLQEQLPPIQPDEVSEAGDTMRQEQPLLMDVHAQTDDEALLSNGVTAARTQQERTAAAESAAHEKLRAAAEAATARQVAAQKEAEAIRRAAEDEATAIKQAAVEAAATITADAVARTCAATEHPEPEPEPAAAARQAIVIPSFTAHAPVQLTHSGCECLPVTHYHSDDGLVHSWVGCGDVGWWCASRLPAVPFPMPMSDNVRDSDQCC